MPAIPAAILLDHYLMVSVFMFASGILCIVTKRNTIAVLMGIELMLNAANLNFVAFARYHHADVLDLNGHLMAMFVIILAAAEAAVALAITVNFVRRFKTVDINQADTLKG
ncbi:NADH-quinone oxidoreductase subunit NuoK [Planctomycetota bacterium]